LKRFFLPSLVGASCARCARFGVSAPIFMLTEEDLLDRVPVSNVPPFQSPFFTSFFRAFRCGAYDRRFHGAQAAPAAAPPLVFVARTDTPPPPTLRPYPGNTQSIRWLCGVITHFGKDFFTSSRSGFFHRSLSIADAVTDVPSAEFLRRKRRRLFPALSRCWVFLPEPDRPHSPFGCSSPVLTTLEERWLSERSDVDHPGHFSCIFPYCPPIFSSFTPCTFFPSADCLVFLQEVAQ